MVIILETVHDPQGSPVLERCVSCSEMGCSTFDDETCEFHAPEMNVCSAGKHHAASWCGRGLA